MKNERQALSLAAHDASATRTVFLAPAVAAAIAALLVLGGCGQKGPLYLPAQAGAPARPAAASTTPLPPAPSTSSPGIPSGIVPER